MSQSIDPVSSPEAYRRSVLSALGDDDPVVAQTAAPGLFTALRRSNLDLWSGRPARGPGASGHPHRARPGELRADLPPGRRSRSRPSRSGASGARPGPRPLVRARHRRPLHDRRHALARPRLRRARDRQRAGRRRRGPAGQQDRFVRGRRRRAGRAATSSEPIRSTPSGWPGRSSASSTAGRASTASRRWPPSTSHRGT